MMSPTSSAPVSLRARCAKYAILLLVIANFATPIARASVATGAPATPRTVASSPSGSATRSHVQDYGGKEAATDEMRSLQAQMADLRQQLAANPQNMALRAQLKTVQADFEAISASMGGDVPGPAGYEPAPESPEKDAVYAQMRELQKQMTTLRSRLATQPESTRLQQQYDAAASEYRQLSDSLGGDEPGPLASTSLERPEVVALSPTGCLATTTTFTNTTPVPIPTGAPSVTTSTITVSGKDIYTWDIDATTFITHTFCADLDITLTSPAGTVVTLTTDNGGINDNCFNGTIWDDQANPGNQVPYANNPGLATDRVYANLVVAPTLVPEEAMGAFKGENPNGVWTLTVSDDLTGDGGSIDQWSLGITTFPVGPAETTTSFTNSTPVAIPTTVSTVSSTLAVAGAGTAITNLVLTTNITHTFTSDLQVTLMSPGGKIVTLTSNNGGSNDNNFAGTVWDDDSNPGNPVPYANNPGLATDRLYANLVVATPLVAEESLSAFFGDDPTGTWTITIADQFTGDGGALNSWTLAVTTGSCLGPCSGTLQTFNNTTPVPISTGAPAVVTSTITVAGAGASLLDANVTTFITHTFCADLDITLTSPTGTVVTLTTDNGGINDNCFNGTVWDDQANLGTQVPYANNPGLASDRLYANLVTATPLVPEEAMGAFKGENPNGVWTLTVSDDLTGDGGSINSWSLGLRTNPVAPTVVQNALTFTNSTPVPISTGAASTVTSTQSVAGLTAPIGTVRLTTAITHTFASDLQVTLQSPAGTIVTLTSNNGGSNDNVFNGTLWDDKANPANPVPYANNPGLATDRLYANLVVATPLVPEEAMAAFDGEAGNGTWTVTIADQFTGDGGALNSWTLEITTVACGQTPCTLTCPANVTVPNDAAQCGAVVNYAAPTTSGTCSTVTCVPASGSFFPVGTTTVNCTAGAAACSFTVTVNDTQPPTITCPANVTQANDANQCGAVVTYPAPTVTDNCPGLVPNCTPASGSFFPVGTTAVTCTVTDAGANMVSCMFSVTVNDTQAPTITCPANITQANDANQCGAVVSFAPTASDNCPGVTVACTPASGSFFPVGVTPVNCTATDASANTATCSFSVTVQDTQAPTITCPANIVTPANMLMGMTLGAIVAYPAPVASDNCPGVTVACVPASGSFFPVGVNTVTCTAMDSSVNSPDSICTFTITVGTPFTNCYVDDATGDMFSIVADPTSPLYRFWQYKVAATAQVLSGFAEGLSYIPGRSLIAYDRDSPDYVMNANISFSSKTATVTVKVRATNVTHSLRDRLITDDPPCQ